MKCPCGSLQNFDSCCEPFIKGAAQPDTAEKLMRARYTAYTLGDVAYIQNTLAPESRGDFDVAATKAWAEKSEWKGLKILEVEKGGPNDKKGVVEFIATFSQDGEAVDHHEVSTFRKSERGLWLFVEGDAHTHKAGEGHHHHHHAKPVTHVRETPKIGRNDPCPCGSGKKYKKCHGLAADAP